MHLPASRWIARAWAPAVAVGVAGLTAACSGPAAQLDGADVETVLVQGLREQVGGSFEASCPSPIPAVAGTTVDCSVSDGEAGDAVTVRVTVTDAEGAFQWAVVPPVPAPSAGGVPQPSPSAS